MKRTILLMGVACLLSLGGCVALGSSQSESEQAYVTVTTGTDAGILLGKLTPDQVSTACIVDTAYYTNLVSTRNPADGVKSYAPADNMHAKLQADGSHLSALCAPA